MSGGSEAVAAQRSVDARFLTPFQLDAAKVVACVLMLVDHINCVIYKWSFDSLFYVGRAAFPLFALCFVMALGANPDRQWRALKRLALWCCVAQPLHAMLMPFPVWAANILASFIVGLVLIYQHTKIAMDGWRGRETILRGLSVLGALAFARYNLAVCGYGEPGVVMIYCGYMALHGAKGKAGRCVWGFCAALGVMMMNPMPTLEATLETALFATLLPAVVLLCVWMVALIAEKTERFMQKNTLPIFYCGHLLVLKCVLLAQAYA